ncbi:hypothetical protein P9112_007914 [Eukaryota sp. TZLM1-RC]
MKVKVISRSDQRYTSTTPGAVAPILKNRDPKLHPFQVEREYVRALNATKLQRVFAKPFIAALQGHNDGVCALATHKSRLNLAASGACNGEIRLWNLSSHNTLWSSLAHSGWVRDVSFSRCNNFILSASDDKSLKFWSLKDPSPSPVRTLLSSNQLYSVDSSWDTENPCYATAGSNGVVEIWSDQTADPIQTFKWGDDTLTHVRFNPSETNLLLTTGYDRSLTLMDTRQETPLRRVTMEMRNNQVAWIPSEPMNFLAANEDSNVYLYDMRNLKRSLAVFKDHMGPVLSVSPCPTGRFFVSGSYDKTVRIWNMKSTKSADVYHTQRMQRIFAVQYSMDANFVLSGSDDGCVRLWKAKASDSLKPLTKREEDSRQYSTALINKFKDVPELSSIRRKRHLPKLIHKQRIERHEENQRLRKKRQNVVRHSKPGTVPKLKPEKEKKIVGVQE